MKMACFPTMQMLIGVNIDTCTYTIKNAGPIHGPGLTEQQCQVDPLEAD